MAVGFRHLERGLIGLRARVAEENTRQAAGAGKALGERSRVLVVIQIGTVNQAPGLFANHFGEARMRVSQCVDANACQQIEIALAGSIVKVAAFTALQHHRVTGVILEQILGF
jgi:hypothetical protein